MSIKLHANSIKILYFPWISLNIKIFYVLWLFIIHFQLYLFHNHPLFYRMAILLVKRIALNRRLYLTEGSSSSGVNYFYSCMFLARMTSLVNEQWKWNVVFCWIWCWGYGQDLFIFIFCIVVCLFSSQYRYECSYMCWGDTNWNGMYYPSFNKKIKSHQKNHDLYAWKLCIYLGVLNFLMSL